MHESHENESIETFQNPEVHEAASKFLDYLNIKDKPVPSNAIFILGGLRLLRWKKLLNYIRPALHQK